MDKQPIAILTGITLVLLIAIGWIFMPLPPERYYDMDLTPLAMTHQEGYCAGVAYWAGNGRRDDPKMAKECRSEGDLDTERDLSLVVFWFCRGIKDSGFNGNPRSGCEEPIDAARMWPTLDGALTIAFSDRYPYPGDIFVAKLTDDGPDSRTGDRDGFTR